MHGIINIYKEKGYTSHDVVAKARGILREKKIGHTGTLDPEAEGVLPLCIGKATKVVPYLTDANKCYEAEVILGSYTTTEDATGEVIETFDVKVTKEQIEEVVSSFVGEYTQIPPMYSAIKVNGVRLYELARQGKVVERPARQVHIYKCDIIEYLDETRFRIRVLCSKGTYIRTLCTDIGKQLGCGAHMGYLLRTQVGNYYLKDSLKLSALEEVKENVDQYMAPIDTTFTQYSSITLNNQGEKILANGGKLTLHHINETQLPEGNIYRVYDAKKQFRALYKKEKHNLLKVEKMFFA